jgi:hypothetical protein
MNWYAYCGNNPLSRTDPTGLDVGNPGNDGYDKNGNPVKVTITVSSEGDSKVVTTTTSAGNATNEKQRTSMTTTPVQNETSTTVIKGSLAITDPGAKQVALNLFALGWLSKVSITYKPGFNGNIWEMDYKFNFSALIEAMAGPSLWRAYNGKGSNFSSRTMPLSAMNADQYSAWRTAADSLGYDSLEALVYNSTSETQWSPILLIGDTFQVAPIDSITAALAIF